MGVISAAYHVEGRHFRTEFRSDKKMLKYLSILLVLLHVLLNTIDAKPVELRRVGETTYAECFRSLKRELDGCLNVKDEADDNVFDQDKEDRREMNCYAEHKRRRRSCAFDKRLRKRIQVTFKYLQWLSAIFCLLMAGLNSQIKMYLKYGC